MLHVYSVSSYSTMLYELAPPIASQQYLWHRKSVQFPRVMHFPLEYKGVCFSLIVTVHVHCSFPLGNPWIALNLRPGCSPRHEAQALCIGSTEHTDIRARIQQVSY